MPRTTLGRKQRLGLALLATLAFAGGAAAQTSPDATTLLQEGIAAHLARDMPTALARFEAALGADSTSYEATWRAGETLLDIGKQTPDTVKSPARDSLYARAEAYGRRAVALNPDGTDGRYVLAAAIGRASLTKSKKERVRRAAEIRAEALRALELDASNHKAYHVMGRWNAEIMRLSGLERFFARNFLGGKIFSAASWDSAVVYMDRAVAASPETIYHHLDLAEILVERGRYTEARGHLEEIARLPVFDVMDPAYKEQAQALERRIHGKADKGR